MKKSIVILALTSFFALTGCKNSGEEKSKTEETKTEQSAEVYTCSMDPEVVSDKPGSCPKCNMDLEKKTK
ncbi:MAG: hypothetical protein HYX39_09560 [Bacteroidetes bacterium]|nr:hypothetical protein [Bacteroidota bacterium]